MNAGPRSGRSDNHPPVGRPLGLTAVLEQVVSEVFGQTIILQKLLSSRMVAVTAVKDIKRTVILGRPEEDHYSILFPCLYQSFIINLLHVINVVLHLQFDAVAFVVLPAFELLVPVFLS